MIRKYSILIILLKIIDSDIQKIAAPQNLQSSSPPFAYINISLYRNFNIPKCGINIIISCITISEKAIIFIV